MDSPDFNNLFKELQEAQETAKTSLEETTQPPPVDIYDSDLRRLVIDYLDRSYWLDKEYPTKTQIKKYLESEGYKKVLPEDFDLFLDELNDSLENRGLPEFKTNFDKIDPNFALAVTLICDFGDKRSKAAKLKQVGLTTRQWNAFLRRKKNSDYYQTRLDQIWDEDIEASAKSAIARGVEVGDLQYVKYFHEYTDRYRPADTQFVNLSLIISALLEILAKHVTQGVLAEIAMELKTTQLLDRLNLQQFQEIENK